MIFFVFTQRKFKILHLEFINYLHNFYFMRSKKIFLLLLFIVNVCFLFAQDSNPFSVNLEFGSNTVNSTLSDNWPVRQDVGSYYYDGYNSNYVYIDNTVVFFGVKPEYSFFKNKMSVSSGLRFTNLFADLSKANADQGGYFFLRYNSENTNTEYARVKNINETSNYLGLPFELKISPFSIRNISFYFKVGTEFSFKLNTNTSIDFKDNAMDIYKQDIIGDLDIRSNTYYSVLYNSVGVNIDTLKKLKLNIELLLPSFFLTSNNSTLVNMDEFSGIQFSVNLPFK